MLNGQFVHQNIIESSPLKYEESIGWVFHYFIGAGVGLTYPLFYLGFNVSMPVNHLIPGLLWGLATVLFPWLTNFPAFGWGFFGVGAPEGTKPLIAPAIAHSCFGLGMGLVFTMAVAGKGI